MRDQPELKALIDKLAAARQRLAQLAYTPPSAGQQDDWSRQLTRARQDKQLLESELARRSEPFRRQLELGNLRPADVARALPPGWYSSNCSHSTTGGPRATEERRSGRLLASSATGGLWPASRRVRPGGNA